MVILVGRRKVVGELAGPLLNVALVVGFRVVLILLREGLRLVDRQDGADKAAVRYSAERVAGRTDFAVDLETAAKP